MPYKIITQILQNYKNYKDRKNLKIQQAKNANTMYKNTKYPIQKSQKNLKNPF